MKAITLTEPFASLVALGAKRIETRSWSTRYRGPLAIHAAISLNPVGGDIGYHQLVSSEPFHRYVYDRKRASGVIVAVANLADVVRVNENGSLPIDVVSRFVTAEHEASFGNYGPGRYAWLLDDVHALDVPVKARGKQGLWNVPPTTADDVHMALLDAYREAVA